jgi:signal recognition particle subunit SRP54
MFESLSKRLTESLDKLRRKGVLSEADVESALREVRMALLEADVALPVARDFIAGLKTKLVGAEIIKSINPSQMVIKLVYDALVELLSGCAADSGGKPSPLAGEGLDGGGANRTQANLHAPSPNPLPQGERASPAAPLVAHLPTLQEDPLNLRTAPPAIILMCGLQGSGKTTTTGKLALRLRTKLNKRVLVASLDVYRPAAQEQLASVAKTAEVDALPIVAGEMPAAITARALDAARRGGYDVLLLDTAGRLHVDEALMDELKAVKALAGPIETLLVADALTGQDAVNIAKSFHESIGVTGIILTRLDGDGRGGAALSMRAVTGQPIKYMGLGEKLSEFEPFHAERIAGRILDKGDVISLVEKAAEVMNTVEAEDAAKRMMAGKFDLTDMLQQMRQIKKMGGLGGVMGLMPGIGKIKEAMANAPMPDDKMVGRQEAIILAMTPKERANPSLLNASRRRRIANGAGVQVSDVNRLIKQYQQMETMMKQMKKMGGMGKMNPQALKRLLPF